MDCVSTKDLPFHSTMLSVHLLPGLPILRLPSFVPWSITLVSPSDLVTCPYHFSLSRCTVVRRSSYGSTCFMMGFHTCWLVILSLLDMPRISRRHLNSSDGILFCSSPSPLLPYPPLHLVVCQFGSWHANLFRLLPSQSSSGFWPYPLSPGLAISAFPLVCLDFAFRLQW